MNSYALEYVGEKMNGMRFSFEWKIVHLSEIKTFSIKFNDKGIEEYYGHESWGLTQLEDYENVEDDKLLPPSHWVYTYSFQYMQISPF